MPPLVNARDPVLHDIHGVGEILRQPLTTRPQKHYRVYKNITDSYGPLFLPPLPHGHTSVVTSSLMQMLTT